MTTTASPEMFKHRPRARARRKHFHVLKSHGGAENFSKKKLYSSLRRSGLPDTPSRIITDKVTSEVGEGSRTREIYRRALHLVTKTSPIAAVHYSLKRAIFELGPAGFYFEAYVARYFEELGYETTTCQVLPGKFVKHEVDVIATKDGRRTFVECKFHNRIGLKNDIKVTLYVKARWDDLREGPEGKNLDGFCLASNTAFSLDAITYARGSKLHLLGVNAPTEKPFLEEIKALHLYPVTSLKSITRRTKTELLRSGLVVAKDIPPKIGFLLDLGLEEGQVDQLLREIELLSGGHS